MTKEEFIPIASEYYNTGNINGEQFIDMLVEFLKEKDMEKYKMIENYIPSILQHPFFQLNAKFYIARVLDYYECKLEVMKLIDNNKIYIY